MIISIVNWKQQLVKTIEYDQLFSLSNYRTTDIGIDIIAVNCVSPKQNQTCWKFSLFPRADYNISFSISYHFDSSCSAVSPLCAMKKNCTEFRNLLLISRDNDDANGKLQTNVKIFLTVITTNCPTVFSHLILISIIINHLEKIFLLFSSLQTADDRDLIGKS